MNDRAFRPAAVRIYRILLFLYPASFRREYGVWMTQAFRDRARDKGAAHTWAFVGRDLFNSVPKQIMEASLMEQRWLAVLTALASFSLVAFLAAGIGSPLVLVSGVVLLVAIIAVVATGRGERPTEYYYAGGAPKRWTWWTVLATALAVLYVAAGIGQLIDDPKASNVGALAIILGFAGLILGGLALRARSKIVGNWMVMFATVPALMFFWAVLPPLIALAIIVGAVTEVGKSTPRTPQTA